MIKTLFLFLALGACSVPRQNDSDNKAEQFFHMIDSNAPCVAMGQNPYSYDSAICKNGSSIVFVQAGPGIVPRFGVIYSPTPAPAQGVK